MTNEILITLIGLGTTVASGWASHFLTRKKYKSEVDSTIIANMKESLDFYKQLSDDTNRRLQEVLEKNSKLEEEIDNLKLQVSNLMMSICYDLTCEARVKLPKKTVNSSKKKTNSSKKSNKTKQTQPYNEEY